MKTFAEWLSESAPDLSASMKDTESPAHSTTFVSPSRKHLNPNPASANAQLYQMWLKNRELQIQSGKAAAELSFFQNYQEISSLLKVINNSCARHNRIITMISRGLGEAADSTQMLSKTVANPRATPPTNASLYQLEKKLLGTKKRTLANEFSLHEIMKRRGIDMHKHIRQAAGMTRLTRENIDQTTDFEYVHKPDVRFPQSQGVITLSLDGPQFFKDPQQLISDVERANAATEDIASQIHNLYRLTGGVPQPYKPDPDSVLG